MATKIIRLQAENVKRLNVVEIKPDGDVVTISGRNGQGKTSVLDAIAYALGGKGTQPTKPIREGAEFASVVVELDDLVVRRRWTANDKSTLVVESKNGARYPSPQAVLDKLVGELTFDPLAFSRMKPADQVATLKRVAGLDFAKLDAERDRVFADRTVANRDVAAVRAQVNAMPEVDAPDAEVSVAAIARKHSEAVAAGRALDALKREQAECLEEIEASKRVVADLQRQIKEELALQGTLAARSKEMLAKIEATTVPDADALAAQLESAEGTNAKVRLKARRAEKLAALADAQALAAKLTARLEAIDAEKLAKLSESPMPVPGLSFTAAGVTFDGIPFDQASAAEQLRVSVAMGLSLNPELRVMLIRDGSLLDADSMTLLKDLAERHEAQIWVEKVADGDAVGVVIEDGRVVVAAAELVGAGE
jgi:hypothetical protein